MDRSDPVLDLRNVRRIRRVLFHLAALASPLALVARARSLWVALLLGALASLLEEWACRRAVDRRVDSARD